MKKLLTTLIIMLAGTLVFAAVALQEDFTASDDGTLPASLDGEWDPGVDLIVDSLTDLGIPADHTGGDGYALTIGDIGYAGYNFVFPASYETDVYADGSVEAWVYLDFDGITVERDYGVFFRTEEDSAGGGVYPARNGYWLFVTVNSSWGTYVPTDKTAFILKRDGDPVAWVQIGSEGTGVYDTGWHQFKLEVVGDQVNGYIDGNLEVSGTDTTYASGSAGMVFYEGSDVNAVGVFDNFIIDEVIPTKVNKDVWTVY